jgi:hypothetical protein
LLVREEGTMAKSKKRKGKCVGTPIDRVGKPIDRVGRPAHRTRAPINDVPVVLDKVKTVV